MNQTSSNPFSIEIVALAADIDELNHVNNVVFVRWVQDVAAAHWMATSTDELRACYSWMLLRHEIDYLGQAFLGDRLIGTTWVGEAKGATFERFVELKKDGKVITKSRTVWALLDAKTLKPRRIDKAMNVLFAKNVQ
ncbi:MAG: acyl-CoA thioesterase [Flammeovirgaceae bacterium]|jgi:acyl-CoA thioester hydrolase|nr:acyl-CoA thioesterase [Flammeovirgaceae bacterium]